MRKTVKRAIIVALVTTQMLTGCKSLSIAEPEEIPASKALIAEIASVETSEVKVENNEEEIIIEDIIEEVEVDIFELEKELPYWKDRMKGTDKWDELVLEVCDEENINPILVKTIICIESGGDQYAINTKNKNHTVDRGLGQVNSNWQYDAKRLLNEPQYNLRAVCAVIKAKINDAKRQNDEPTIFEVLWRYNGKSSQGKRYANKVYAIYNCFKNKTDSPYMSETEEE